MGVSWIADRDKLREADKRNADEAAQNQHAEKYIATSATSDYDEHCQQTEFNGAPTPP